MEHKIKILDFWINEHILLEYLAEGKHVFNLHSDFANEKLGRY